MLGMPHSFRSIRAGRLTEVRRLPDASGTRDAACCFHQRSKLSRDIPGASLALGLVCCRFTHPDLDRNCPSWWQGHDQSRSETAMNNPFHLLVYENQQLVYSVDLPGPMELGRQGKDEQGPYGKRKLGTG